MSSQTEEVETGGSLGLAGQTVSLINKFRVQPENKVEGIPEDDIYTCVLTHIEVTLAEQQPKNTAPL